MMCVSEAPSARLRSTYSRSFRLSTCARISRAVEGHDVIPITRMMLPIDGPSTAASAIASGRNGITRNHSVTRISTPPTRPPKNPAVTPTSDPMTIASTVAASPTSRLMRAPQITWVSTLRPRWSVPSGKSPLGCAHAGFWVVLTPCSPAESASSGAAIAMRITSASSTSPTMPGRLRRYSRHAAASARRRRSHAILRGDARAAALTPHPPADRASRTAGPPAG